MSKRQPDHRLIKSHRSYTTGEAARLLAIHKNTVRQWMKVGLPTIDNNHPILILGRELISFLQRRRAEKKQPCLPGQLYCVRCHSTKSPAAGMVQCLPLNPKVVNVRGRCPDCASLMHRCVSIANIKQFFDTSDFTFPQALPHIGEISRPSVNSDFKGDHQP
jgi:hypothetical protein